MKVRGHHPLLQQRHRVTDGARGVGHSLTREGVHGSPRGSAWRERRAGVHAGGAGHASEPPPRAWPPSSPPRTAPTAPCVRPSTPSASRNPPPCEREAALGSEKRGGCIRVDAARQRGLGGPADAELALPAGHPGISAEARRGPAPAQSLRGKPSSLSVPLRLRTGPEGHAPAPGRLTTARRQPEGT